MRAALFHTALLEQEREATMTKEEMIEGIQEQIEFLELLRAFLERLKPEALVTKAYLHGVTGFLLTAVDYLMVNLEEMKNRVRMS